MTFEEKMHYLDELGKLYQRINCGRDNHNACKYSSDKIAEKISEIIDSLE